MLDIEKCFKGGGFVWGDFLKRCECIILWNNGTQSKGNLLELFNTVTKEGEDPLTPYPIKIKGISPPAELEEPRAKKLELLQTVERIIKWRIKALSAAIHNDEGR